MENSEHQYRAEFKLYLGSGYMIHVMSSKESPYSDLASESDKHPTFELVSAKEGSIVAKGMISSRAVESLMFMLKGI